MFIKTAKRLFSFIVALVAIQNGEIFSQKITNNTPALIVERQSFSLYSPVAFPVSGLRNFSLSRPFVNDGQYTGKKSGNLIPQNYFSNNLTFFCRTELQFEKATSVPFRFRLGSVAYTDYLEQKPNAARFWIMVFLVKPFVEERRSDTVWIDCTGRAPACGLFSNGPLAAAAKVNSIPRPSAFR